MVQIHVLRVTTWGQSRDTRRWYPAATEDYWLQPARVVKSPVLLGRDPDIRQEADRARARYNIERVEGEREWIAYYALPWYKRIFAKRPVGVRPIFKQATMDEVLSK